MKKTSSGCKSPKASRKASKATKVTVGMDLGDKTSRYCMLDENGEVLRTIRAESMSESFSVATGPAHAGGIQSHKDCAVKRCGRGVNQARDFVRTPNYRQADILFRVGHLVPAPGLVE